MEALKTNLERLVVQSVIGEVASPLYGFVAFRVGADGTPRALPSTGGIVYNFRIGDSATQLAGDHVEPGVSIRNFEGDRSATSPTNLALITLACIGNRARVVTGDAKGELGYVTGLHGGINHVLVDFPTVVLEQLVIGDKIQIKAVGMGLELADFPAVTAMNLDPTLLERMGVRAGTGGLLDVPVTHIVPARTMGSGLGHPHSDSGDYDIQMFDPRVVAEHHLDTLRFGDFVAITDAAGEFGRIYLEGAVTIGVVVHSRSDVAGHGPGVTTVLTSRRGGIRPVIDPSANLKRLLYG
jgi:uncharacterized protein DUF4438